MCYKIIRGTVSLRKTTTLLTSISKEMELHKKTEMGNYFLYFTFDFTYTKDQVILKSFSPAIVIFYIILYFNIFAVLFCKLTFVYNSNQL